MEFRQGSPMNLIAMLMVAADPTAQPLPDVVLLDFTAGFCQPCQQMVPLLQRMERDDFPIKRIDITKEPELTRQYHVERIPTLILLVEGKEQERYVGLTAESELRRAMDDAARKLERQRGRSSPQKNQTAATAESPLPSDPSAPEKPLAEVANTEERPGLRGFFDHLRSKFDRDQPTRERFEFPTFRGQSPEADSDRPVADTVMNASVRVRVTDGRMQDSGTGTVVQSTPGLSTVLTCAHLFQGVSKDAVVQVDMFRDGKVLTYPARVIDGNKDSDLALLQIQNKEILPFVNMSTDSVKSGEGVVSVGCSNGEPPTLTRMKVVEVNRYMGPAHILCSQDPARGRSGGGLFNAAGQLIGVCSAADRDLHEGLYMAATEVQGLIEHAKLSNLFESNPPEAFAGGSRQTERSQPALDTPERFTDDEMMARIFDEQSPTGADNSSTSNAPEFEDAALPNPFTEGALMASPSALTASPSTLSQVGETAGPGEITVLIDAKDGSGKQMIVIPKPSPWLVELLTGERLTPIPRNSLANTSSRRSARRPVSTIRLLPVAAP